MAEQALVADIRVGLDKFNADLQKAVTAADRATASIRKSLGSIGSGASPAANEIEKVNAKLDGTAQSANRASSAVGKSLNPALQTMKGLMGALGIELTIRSLVQFATSAINAAESLTGVERQLTSLRGSSKAAANEMAFIRAETDRLALSNVDGAKAYARLANAAKGTKLDGEALKFVFRAISETMRATGASSEEYNRVLNQLTQTMAKGKFQGEELTTLAEAGVPAYQKLAEAMGVTTKRLSEMLQAGSVSSENMILLAKQLHKDYGDLAKAASTTIPAQFTRGFNTIFNEFTDLVKGVLTSSEAIKAIEFDSNILDIFPDPKVISQTTDNIIKIVVTISELTSAIFQKVGDIIVGTFQNIASFLGKMLPNLTSVFDKFANWSTKLGQALGFVSQDIDTVSLSTDELQSSLLSLTSVRGLGDVVAPYTGAKGKALAQDVRHLTDEFIKFLGLDVKPIVDPKIQTDAAKKVVQDVPPIVAAAIEQMEAKAKTLAILDPEKEKKAAQDVHEEFLRVLDKANQDRMRYNEEVISQENDMSRTILDLRQKLEDDSRKEREKTHDAFLKIVERTNAQIVAEEQKTAQETEKIFDTMKENIQSALAGSIRDAMTGDLDNIKDFADTISDLFTDTAATIASELLSSFAMEPLMNQVTTSINKLVAQAKQKIEQLGQLLGISGAGGGRFGEIAGGIFAGVGAGMATTQMAGLNNTGAMIGNLAGAVVGGVVGAFTVVGPLIGAAAGSAVGGVIGGLLGDHEEKVRLILQTSLGAPTRPHEGPTSRSPFGVVSLFDKSQVSMESASAATLAISEIDQAIAGYLNEQQRAIVTQYFQTAVPEASTTQAVEVDDAIAKALQLRLFHALTALTDQVTATNIVGEPFSADAGNIQNITERAEEALSILRMIEDFKIGPLSDTAAAIQAINEKFQALRDSATSLGLPVEEIVAEQNRLLGEITTNFNQGIADSLLAITDPVAAEFAALERMQQERMQNAIDAGANLVEVEKLNAAERLELEKQVNEEIQMQSQAARGNIVGLILGMTDPFAAAMHSIYQQLVVFQAQVAEGLIPQELVDRWLREATDAAQAQEDARAKAAADATADFNQQVANDLLGITDPIAQQWDDLEQRQKRQRDQAVAIGADLEQLDRLHALERADLERRLAKDRADTNEAANRQINDSTIIGAQQVDDAIVSGNQYVNDSIISGNQSVNDAIVIGAGGVYNAVISGAQSAASVVSSVFANAASNAAAILGGMAKQANAAANALAAAGHPRLPGAPTGGTPVRRTPTGLSYSGSRSTGRVVQLRTIPIPNISTFNRTPVASRVDYSRRPAVSQSSSGGGSSGGGGGGGGGRSSGGGGGGGGSSRAAQQRSDAENRRQEAQRQADQRKQEAERKRQEAEQKRQQAAAAKSNIQGMILGLTDPFGAAMHQVNEQIANFRQQAKEGLIPKSLVDRFAKLAVADVKKKEAERQQQLAEERRDQQMRFGQALLQFVNPALATMIDLNEQVKEFQELADKGIIPQSRLDQFRRLSLASVQVDRALDAISGGSGSNIKGIGDAFKSFIEAGLPEKSEAIRSMQALTDQFAGLVESAQILGLSTEDLTKSFKAQSEVIRQDAIKAIDQSFEARREALKGIDDFLQQMKVSDVLPGLMQINEARQEFVKAATSGQVEKAVAAAAQYERIARQQLGSTADFFKARAEIERMLTTLEDRENASIERERAIAIRNEERQLQMVSISRNSMDYLRIVSTHSTTTANGINEMIKIARSQTNEMIETRKLLTRVMNTLRA